MSTKHAPQPKCGTEREARAGGRAWLLPLREYTLADVVTDAVLWLLLLLAIVVAIC